MMLETMANSTGTKGLNSGKGVHGAVTAVVIGLHPTALGVIRSLAHAGVSIIALGQDLRVPSAATRFCRKKIRCDINNPDELVTELVRLGERLDSPAVLFPCGDSDALTVSGARESLRRYYRFLIPEHNRLQTLLDKTLFYRFADQQHLPIPRTYWIATTEETQAVGACARFPCILKPPRNTLEWERLAPGKKVLWVHDAAELLAQYKHMATAQPLLLVQEWIEGGDDDVYFVLAYCDRELRVRAHFCGRKLRQWPPLLGSTACACDYADPELEQRSLALLQQWQVPGLSSIEWKQDRRTGEYFIIEPTVGRCDLQSPVALLSGINFPLIACFDGLDLPVPLIEKQPSRGGCWLHEERELLAVWHGLKTRQFTAWQWIRSIRGPRVWVYLSIRDPMPIICLLGLFLKRVIRKLFS
jgi:D-aspartate ligase